MKKILTVPKGTGTVIGNTLRQLSLTQLECYRPIAFSLNRDFNKIDASNSIVESTLSIASNLTDMVFISKEGVNTAEKVTETYDFLGVLKPENMASESFIVHGAEGALVSCLDGSSVELKVIYRKGNASFTSLENRRFISETGEDPDEYIHLASRHTLLTSFTFAVAPSPSGQEESLTLELNSKHADEATLLDSVFETWGRINSAAMNSYSAE